MLVDDVGSPTLRKIQFQPRCLSGRSSGGQLPAPLRALGWPSRACCSTAQLTSLSGMTVT